MADVVQIKDTRRQIDTSVGPGDFNRIFNAQKEAFHKNRVPSAEERIDRLKRLKKAIIKYHTEISQATCSDFGHRSYDESFWAEIYSSIQPLDYAVKHIKKWMKPTWRMPGFQFLPAVSKVYYQPLGVVGIIVPWNYPVYLTISPLACALSAGNRVIIRMSRHSPHISELLKKIVSENFREDEIAIFTGEEISGTVFTQNPWDHILFTGSTEAGKHIMKAAAEHLIPVTLELGGKSPVIISQAFPMEDAAQRIAWGKTINAGQTCVAPDYVYCPENRVKEFISAIRKAIEKMFPTLAVNPDFTGIENDAQFRHLTELLEDAKSKGAEIIEINPANESFDRVRKMAPQLVLNATYDMLVLQKEIFGPILPVLPYTSIEEVISQINQHPRPLALYYFDYDRKKAEYVIRNTFSGGATVNDTMVHAGQDNLPFGGVGHSGMGKYHGFEGFLNFSNPKGVLFKSRLNFGKLIYPPYNTFMHRMMKKLLI